MGFPTTNETGQLLPCYAVGAALDRWVGVCELAWIMVHAQDSILPTQGTESAHLSLCYHESIQPFKDKMENQTSSQVSRTMCEHYLASGLVLGMKTFRGQVQVPSTVESNQFRSSAGR